MNKAGGQGMGEAMVKVRENISKVALKICTADSTTHTSPPKRSIYTLIRNAIPSCFEVQKIKRDKGGKKITVSTPIAKN